LRVADKVATVFFEVTSADGMDALIDENIDWLTKDQGVQLDRASEQKQEFEAANLEWKRISWSGNSREWGSAAVLLLGRVSIQICSAPRALPTAHFDRNERHVISATAH
jgi:hypothetical protein